MRVMLNPADRYACGSYRVIWPGEALQKHDFDVTFTDINRWNVVQRRDIFGRESVVGLTEPVDTDVFVIQRPLWRKWYELIRLLQADGIAVVVEIDDNLKNLHLRNAARESTRETNRDHNHDWLKKSCEVADLVTVSTPALAAQYGSHGRVAVIPNYVPERYLDLGRPTRDVPWIGWSGNLEVHPGDLEVTAGAVGDVVGTTACEFHLVGAHPKQVRKILRLPSVPHCSGMVPLDDYPQALGQLDVGIVPLKPSRFNEAKSWLKGLEMAALGVPFIASPTSPYRELHELGAGELAFSPKDWRSKLRKLVKNPGERESLSMIGREVAQGLTIEANAWRWAQAWQRAILQRDAA